MAGFKKHIEVASITSGLLATTILGAQIISPTQAVILWATGTFGGILPDIDSDNSTTLNVIFSALTLIFICLILAMFAKQLSVLEIWLAIGCSYGVLNYLVRPVFEYFTVHRGIFHSILGGLFFGFGGTTIGYHLLQMNSKMSWLFGLFIFFGFITHLILDEIYSVDFMNMDLKRSFGSALKLFEYKDLKISAAMLLVVGALFYLTPKSASFVDTMSSQKTLVKIKDNFLPNRF